MKTVKEIVAAVSKLDASQYAKLRQQLDRLEKRIWEAELSAATAQMAKANITDKDIDRMVLRRRRESRR